MLADAVDESYSEYFFLDSLIYIFKYKLRFRQGKKMMLINLTILQSFITMGLYEFAFIVMT